MGDAANDALDRDIGCWTSDFDEECDPDPDGTIVQRPNRTCRYCGKGKLHWEKGLEGWRLFDGVNIHSCEKFLEIKRRLDEKA